MSVATTTYQFHTKGHWSPLIHISGPEGDLGVLNVLRNRWGMVTGAAYTPLKGEKLEIRRDPGILRSQFSLWSEGREWLGASLRWSFIGREIDLSTGTRPMRLLPLPGFDRGWALHAPKTGQMAQVHLGRDARVEVFRRMDFEVVLFALFLGYLSRMESWWPGPIIEDIHETKTRTSTA
jgi:hypothetical protein